MAADEKIGLKDMISLALKGWSKEDIKDLISMAKTEESRKTDEEPQAGAGPEPAPADQGGHPEPEKETDPLKPEETIDYKALYEKSQAELEKAQAANRSADVKGPTPEDREKELFNTIASYM